MFDARRVIAEFAYGRETKQEVSRSQRARYFKDFKQQEFKSQLGDLDKISRKLRDNTAPLIVEKLGELWEEER